MGSRASTDTITGPHELLHSEIEDVLRLADELLVRHAPYLLPPPVDHREELQLHDGPLPDSEPAVSKCLSAGRETMSAISDGPGPAHTSSSAGAAELQSPTTSRERSTADPSSRKLRPRPARRPAPSEKRRSLPEDEDAPTRKVQIVVRASRRKYRRPGCEHDGCGKTATFGYPGRRSRSCGPYRLPGMIGLRVRRCAAGGCAGSVIRSQLVHAGDDVAYCLTHMRGGRDASGV